MDPELLKTIATPAVLIDTDVLDRNLARMAAFCEDAGVSLRPHFKSHRLEEICRRQKLAGCRGITCAKLSEAEVLLEKGIDHVLIANEVVGRPKLERLAKLARRHKVTVGVDNLEVARELGAIAREIKATVGVLIEVNIGLDRCGVAPGRPTVELADRCSDIKGLSFRGLMGYEGHAVRLPPAEKEQVIKESIGKLLETAERCGDAGLPVKTISCGGTGTYSITGRIPGVTELQCGTYALMDLLFHDEAGAEFDFACTVLGTVISRPAEDRAIVDTGRKALHPSFGMARPADLDGAELTAIHSEHGILRLSGEARRLRVGDPVRFIPSYLEGTINLYDRVHAITDGELVGEWPVTGRGLSQ